MERLDTLSLNHNVITELGPGWFEGRPYILQLIDTIYLFRPATMVGHLANIL
jgi:hypothetical protein